MSFGRTLTLAPLAHEYLAHAYLVSKWGKEDIGPCRLEKASLLQRHT